MIILDIPAILAGYDQREREMQAILQQVNERDRHAVRRAYKREMQQIAVLRRLLLGELQPAKNDEI